MQLQLQRSTLAAVTEQSRHQLLVLTLNYQRIRHIYSTQRQRCEALLTCTFCLLLLVIVRSCRVVFCAELPETCGQAEDMSSKATVCSIILTAIDIVCARRESFKLNSKRAARPLAHEATHGRVGKLASIDKLVVTGSISSLVCCFAS